MGRKLRLAERQASVAAKNGHHPGGTTAAGWQAYVISLTKEEGNVS